MSRLNQPWPVCALLVLMTALVFFPVRSFDFVNYDDSDYVTANSHVLSGISGENVVWAFETGHASNWHPLTWISHQLDCQLFGPGPGPAHLVNLALHALNAVLLFLVLRSLTGMHWRSAAVAALFAVHPLRVESVAWISERKDVLSGFFFLLTLGSYARYVHRQRVGPAEPGRALLWYGASLLCFALGLMSKPMLVTVPFLLLLLDYWPFARWYPTPPLRPAGRLLLEKSPFLLLAIVSSVITFVVQREGGAVSTVLPLSDRVGNAVVSYVRYIEKTIFPVNLSVLYPHPGHWPVWMVLGAGLLLALVTIVVAWQWRRHPFLPVGWFWFIGMLVPVIGIIQVGIQSMADRYTYLPGIGLLLIIVWGAAEVAPSLGWSGRALIFGSVVPVVLCSGICTHQVQYWRDSQALFQHAIDVTRNNYLAYNNLGYYLSGKGQFERAKENYQKSLAINPVYSDALNNFGFALAAEGKYRESIPYYEAALRSSPQQPEIHNNFGNALSECGRLDEAVAQYRIVLSLDPSHAEANNNLGIVLAMQGHLDEAVEHFRAAIRTKPDYAGAHSNLGNALVAQHRIDDAIAEYESCLRISPKDPQAHNNLGNAFMEEGKVEIAIDQYTKALELNSVNPEAHFNLAMASLRVNRPKEAIAHFQAVLRLNPDNAEARRQLELLTR